MRTAFVKLLCESSWHFSSDLAERNIFFGIDSYHIGSSSSMPAMSQDGPWVAQGSPLDHIPLPEFSFSLQRWLHVHILFASALAACSYSLRFSDGCIFTFHLHSFRFSVGCMFIFPSLQRWMHVHIPFASALDAYSNFIRISICLFFSSLVLRS